MRTHLCVCVSTGLHRGLHQGIHGTQPLVLCEKLSVPVTDFLFERFVHGKSFL